MKKRFIFNKIMAQSKNEKILVITGARQVGKTTFLKQLFKELSDKSEIVDYFTLEDRDILSDLNESPKNIFKYLKKSDKKQFVLLDEIQYLKDPSYFLKYLYDEKREKIKLIVTGSSSFYIDRKFKDSLSGRKRIFMMYPLSFDEILFFNDIDKENITVEKGRRIKELFFQYCIWGGYPEVVLAENDEERKEILTDIVYSYIKKDILEQNVKREDKFFMLLKMLSSKIGSLLNKNELAKNIGLSTTAIDNYLYVCSKSFHTITLSPFYRNKTKEIVKMPKVYFSDIGVRNFLSRDFRSIEEREDKIKGPILENQFLLKFLHKGIKQEDIKFWRSKNGLEIDFVIEGKKAYEITFNPKKNKNRNMASFNNHFPEIPVETLTNEDFI